MNFVTIRTQLFHCCTGSDGKEYVRFAANNWAVWMGESLEIINNETETAELESAYAANGNYLK